jgi:hypothetical protein
MVVRSFPCIFALPALFAASLLCSCEMQVATGSAAGARFAQAPADRAGLGTKWGETRQSRVGITDFERADPDHPLSTATIYYNDAVGIHAMAGAVAWQRRWSILPAPTESLISIGLKDQNGRFLPGLIVGDRWFVVGEEGRRYSIVVRNKTSLRLEIILSVDGLDVLDGRKASLRKRGYIMPPHSQLTVEGFRQNIGAVAAFRFSPVRESYAAEKYRNTKNVGVIGAAIFYEHGTNLWTGEEVRKRLKANPFPGGFATPP